MNTLLLHLVVCWAVTGQTVGQTDVMPPNPIFDTMITKGVPMPSGTNVKLPPPIMDEMMSPQRQADVLALTASAAHTTVPLFIAKNSSAPMLIKVATIHTDPTYRTVDIAFVARGDWNVLVNPAFGKKILKGKKPPVPGQQNDNTNTVVSAGLLSEKEMKARNLKPIDEKNRKEGWLQTTFNLDAQVHVSATRHVMITQGPTSALFAALIDPRFDNDSQYPNQWRSINPTGGLGPAQLYSGAGFYIKAVKLAQPNDAIFCEYHSIFHEPFGWFQGANVLRANLPKAAMFQAKQFRIKLAIATEDVKNGKPIVEEPKSESNEPSDKVAPSK